MSGSPGDQPDTMDEWMRGVTKQQNYQARAANVVPLVVAATARRLDRLSTSIPLPNAAAGDGTDVILPTNVINSLGNWLLYDSTTGYYTAAVDCTIEFVFDLAFASSATGGRAVRLWWRPTGGGTWYEQVSHNATPGVGGTYTVSMTVTIPLTAGDQVKFTARQNSGAALDLLGATSWPAAIAGNYSSQVTAKLVVL